MHHYIVIAPHTWGRARTISGALRNAWTVGGRAFTSIDSWQVHRIGEGGYVDELGTVHNVEPDSDCEELNRSHHERQALFHDMIGDLAGELGQALELAAYELAGLQVHYLERLQEVAAAKFSEAAALADAENLEAASDA